MGWPETVAQKIAAIMKVLGVNHFDLRYGMGGLSRQAHDQQSSSSGQVAPSGVRELLA
ncbi:hypothetical protein [Pseudonocardia sp.]|uniref:hypothetical protein n=1 Tax=Pseudonocardia sp. TaxID=60912 RepID=UPI00263498C3|nr:hypothetical protein [Pseudonocardia sp.]